jgi:hypothetical protein
MELVISGLVSLSANIITTIIIFLLGYIYFRRPKIKIHPIIAKYKNNEDEKIEYQFKIINKSKMFDAKDFEIKLKNVNNLYIGRDKDGKEQFMPDHKNIPIFYGNLTRLEKYSKGRRVERKRKKQEGYSYGSTYIAYYNAEEPLEELLKSNTNKKYLKLIVSYNTDMVNRGFVVTKYFSLDKILNGHHSNYDDMDSIVNSI